MKREFELMDVLVSIGMIATVFGAYVFFQASNGGAGFATTSATPATYPSIKMLVQKKLQPSMGQAIVDQATLERQYAADISREASKLIRATQAAERSPVGGLDTIEARAAQFQIDHQARVQYVMGTTIVNLTGQAMRAGVLSGDNLSNPYNDRILATAHAKGRKMEEAFARNWQSRLGQWIVAAATQERRYAGHVQERIGQATVDLASTQYAYQSAQADLQNQFKALVAASARTEAQADLFARLSGVEINLQRALGIPGTNQVEIVEARALPEMPYTYLMVASVGLVTVFFFGLTLPRAGRESAEVVHRVEESKRKKYRQAV